MRYFDKTFARFYEVSAPFEWQGCQYVVVQPFYARRMLAPANDAGESTDLLVSPCWHSPDTPQVKDASFMDSDEARAWTLLPVVDETQRIPQAQRPTLIYPVFGITTYDLEQDCHLLMTSDSQDEFSIFRLLRVLAPNVAEVKEFGKSESAVMVYVPANHRYVVGGISYSGPIKLHPTTVKTIPPGETWTTDEIENFCNYSLVQNCLYTLPAEGVSFVPDGNGIVWLFTPTKRWKITRPMLSIAWKTHNFDFKNQWQHACPLVVGDSSNNVFGKKITAQPYVILGVEPRC